MSNENERLAQLVELDDICDEFQSIFARGDRPRIAEFIQRVAPEKRSDLLHELLTIEAALRAEQGEKITADELIREHSEFLSPDSNLDLLKSDIERAIAGTDPQLGLTETRIGSDPRGETKYDLAHAPKIDGFEIIEVLGKGGMGVVFKARQTNLDRPVALKMILQKDHRSRHEVLQRFKAEAKAIAELNDPRFVQIYEVDTEAKKPYMALEFVDGGSLEEYRNGEPVDPQITATLLESASRAMHEAHKKHLVHRDIKPHNILLTKELQPKIADFGLVKRNDQEETEMTQQGTVMGTASYMAPEQSHGQEVGPAADIHALGAVLYCLLTGRPPYLARNVYDTILQVRNNDPVPPSRLSPSVSIDLETICMKCLEKQPEKRYATSEALADDLQRFLDGKPILARPVSKLEHAWRWAKRNPAVAGLASSVAALLVVVATSTSILNWQLAKANKAAGDNLEQANKNLAQAEAAEASYEETANLAMDVTHTTLAELGHELIDDSLERQTFKKIVNNISGTLSQLTAHVDENPLMTRSQAMIVQKLGDVNREAGNLADALVQYRSAFEMTSATAKENSDDEVYQRNLGITASKIGELHRRLGNTALAKEWFECSLKFRQEQLKKLDQELAGKEYNWCLAKIAEASGWIGSLSIELGDPAAALAAYEVGYDVWENKHGENRKIGNFLTHTQFIRLKGDALYQLGDVEGAKKWLDKAMERRIYLHEKKPNDSRSMRDIARGCLSMGDFYIYSRQGNELAWEQYQKAEAQFYRLWQARSDLAVNRTNLATIYYRLGATLERAQEAGEDIELEEGRDAKWYYGECARLRGELAAIDDTDMQALIEWALALARNGEHVQASEKAAVLIANGESNPRLLMQAAYTFALCMPHAAEDAAKVYREKSLKTVQAAITAGWVDWVGLRDDPDLDPIRDDAEFQKIYENLRGKAVEPSA